MVIPLPNNDDKERQKTAKLMLLEILPKRGNFKIRTCNQKRVLVNLDMTLITITKNIRPKNNTNQLLTKNSEEKIRILVESGNLASRVVKKLINFGRTNTEITPIKPMIAMKITVGYIMAALILLRKV